MTNTKKKTSALLPRDLIVVFDNVAQPVMSVRKAADEGDGVDRYLVTTGDSADHHGSTTLALADREWVVKGTTTGRIRRSPSALEQAMAISLGGGR